MADTKPLAGTASVTIDGKSYMLVGKLSYRATQSTRTSLKGMDGVHGFKEEPEVGFIKGTFRDSGAVSTQTLGNATNTSVVASLANGKTIIGRNMWRAGEPVEVDTEEATFDIQWEGADVSEN